jgi:hypothetical protein
VSQSSRGGGCGDGGKGAARLQEEDGRWRSGEPECGPGVRGCVTCRRRLGPKQVPGRTSTLGIAHHLKDYGWTGQGPPGWRRRTWLDGAPARRDMTRRYRQWVRTRRGLTPEIQICRSQGIQTLATAYKRASNGCCAARANTEPRLCVLVSCVFESGPSCTCRLTG